MHRDIHPKIKTPFHSYRSNIPAGTPIVTESKNIPIEHIQVDDKVLSFNHQTNRPEVKNVTSIKSYLVSAIMALVFTTGDTLWATPNHPFWFDGQYVEAENLKSGDTLWAVDGSALILENSFKKDTAARVYNFTVEDNHNYYVGAPGVLVHNDCFLKKLEQFPELAAEIKKLPQELRGKFIEDFFEAGDDVLEVLKGNPGCVKAWEGMWKSTDDGIKALRIKIAQLQKFDNLVSSNNLGLDAEGIMDILNSAAKKGQKWDFPENILDAVKRASDADIPGLRVVHKKFPESADDPFVLRNAKQYQYESSFEANLSFELKGVSFDNIFDGVLIDRKFGHSSSIFDKIESDIDVVYEIINQNRAQSLLEQAQRQINAAGGNANKIRWEISSKDGANGIKQLFNDPVNISNYPGIQNIQIEYVIQKKVL